MSNDPGPACRTCRQSEARCAYLGTCCGTATCSHWVRWTAAGEPLTFATAPDEVTARRRARDRDRSRARYRRNTA